MNAEPAELEIRNPKLEIRNKFKKMEISKTENEALGLNHRWTRMDTDFTGVFMNFVLHQA
jgi:hypothetical protein